MPGVFCPQCGSENREKARFCQVCGASLHSEPSDNIESSQKITTGVVLLGRYRILSELGRGGYGAVYRAWDIHLNKAVAIKENLDASPEAQRQFSREASVLAHLSHPNLVRVTDHFVVPDQGQYLVMDFVEGEDIESLIKRDGAIQLERALVWGSQILAALEYLHSRHPQVLHRDIKPANIRITPDGHAILVDFGLVKIYVPNVPTTHGARGVSPGYAPPEQYGKGKTDARSDIYSFCATLYHILTGKKPQESVLRSPDRDIQPAHTINENIPYHISMALQVGLAMDPDQRFSSASDLRAVLQAPPASITKPEKHIMPAVVPATVAVENAPPPAPPVTPPATPLAAGQPVPSEIQPIEFPAPAPGPVSGKRNYGSMVFVFAGLGLIAIIVLCVMVVGYYQLQVSARATEESITRATSVEAVNATHTAQAIQHTQTTATP